MAVGELVAAAVVDQRVFDAYGEGAPNGIYILSRPGRALPFVVARSWKVPTGMVSEEIRFIGPSGRTIYRWGPQARYMRGSMDLTVEVNRIDDAILDESGAYVASFMIDDEIVGELEVPVYVQQAPAKLPKEVEDGLKKSDVIWVGVQNDGDERTIPAWFVYRNGRIYLLSQKEPGPAEQTVPGIPGAPELVVITRHKARDTALDRFTAGVRVLEGAEWEEAAKALADKRKSRRGAPSESISRWRGSCHIAELTPVIEGV
jgi:hypothetical protein